VTEGNTALAAGDVAGATKQAADVRAMMAALGLDPLDEHWSGAGADEGLRPVVSALVRGALDQREEARERKDYTAADAIRDSLKAAGIEIEDTADGPRWKLRRTDDDA
jgi:cysteinyl-tRNA synthetase